MRLGVLVHFRGIQLENKERKGMLGHLCFWDRTSGDSKHGAPVCLLPVPKMYMCARKQLLLGRHLSPSQLKHVWPRQSQPSTPR